MSEPLPPFAEPPASPPAPAPEAAEAAAVSPAPVAAPVSARTIPAHTLWSVFARSLLLQALWNPERMQGQGFAFALRPVARRLAGDAGEAPWLLRHLGYFNTNPVLSGVALGAVAALEEEQASPAPARPPSAIERTKSMLGPALAAIGDSLVWSSLRPVAAVIGVLWALRGSPYAPFVFLLLYDSFHLTLRARGVFTGYQLGLAALDDAARARFARLRAGLGIAAVLAAAGLVDATAARVFSSAGSTEWLWAAAGLALGVAWGGGRRVSATALGCFVFAIALAWATLSH